MSRVKRIAAVGLIITGLSAALPAFTRGEEEKAEEVTLPHTLVTEGATPATEVEGTFATSRSRTERTYQLALSSLQYAPVPWFGLKLAVPFGIRDPRDTQPTVAGIGDVSLMAKVAPLLLPAHQFALSGGSSLPSPRGASGGSWEGSSPWRRSWPPARGSAR